ncbi:hypothetical protein [Actinoplanes xinjiangensis]|uniref:Uncharacterized protein n=1 Tax=Actinoplanes xinjiangensis TaxID=512350 RepID=A0A316F2M6_9ACTN|nr:hypothetical protein [Actinoplanes xinjiangensis]PWK30310.1 hypothetical protein BC793_13933 [Actinoplanes xinjiangensis]GIF44407.1 hypothetical protein Axi01nite_87180 [Actinoplanes xinjiangensis]
MSEILDWIARTSHDFWEWIGKTNPDTWAAAAGWTTACIAVIASVAAFRQVRIAREVREEQAQPYVVAFMEPSQAEQHILELAIKNFGTTAAHDVRVESNPPLVRTASEHEKESETVKLFDIMPVMAPGQEWRIFWDSTLRRKDAGLPDRFEITIYYKDSHSKEMKPTKAVLDWTVYKSRMWVSTYGQHHAAKALREISSTVSRWSEFGGGLKVFSRDGDAKDEARKLTPEDLQRLEDINDRVLGRKKDPELPAPESPTVNPAGEPESLPALTEDQQDSEKE